jgi:hypothetical protein
MRKGRLEELLKQPPSSRTWAHITDLLDDWPDADGLGEAVTRAATVLDEDWPDDLRIVPVSWLSLLVGRKGPSKRVIEKRGKRGHPALSLCRSLKTPSGYRNLGSTAGKKIAKEPLFSNILRVDLAGEDLDDKVAHALRESPLLQNIGYLDISRNSFTDAGQADILSAPSLNLTELTISAGDLPLTTTALSEASWTPNLISLEVCSWYSPDVNGGLPLEALPLRDIKALKYDRGDLPSQAASVAACPWFSRLTRLDLGRNTHFDLSALKSLLETPPTGLEWLSLSECPIGDEGVALLRALELPNLTRLDLSTTGLTDGCARELLAGGPWKEGCHVIITGNQVEGMDAEDWLRRFRAMVDELRSDPEIKVLCFQVNPPAPESDLENLKKYFHTIDPDIEAFYRVCNGIQLRWTRLDKAAAAEGVEGVVAPMTYAETDQKDEDGVFLVESIETLCLSTKDLVWFDWMDNDEIDEIGGFPHGQLNFHRSLRTFERITYSTWAFLATCIQPYWTVVVAQDVNTDFDCWRPTTVSSWLEIALQSRAEIKLRREKLSERHGAVKKPYIQATPPTR